MTGLRPTPDIDTRAEAMMATLEARIGKPWRSEDITALLELFRDVMDENAAQVAALRDDRDRWMNTAQALERGSLDRRAQVAALTERLSAAEAEAQMYKNGIEVNRAWTSDMAAEVERYVAASEAVRKLHFVRGSNILGRPVCNVCLPLEPVPCPTVRALDAVLAVSDDPPADPVDDGPCVPGVCRIPAAHPEWDQQDEPR